MLNTEKRRSATHLVIENCAQNQKSVSFAIIFGHDFVRLFFFSPKTMYISIFSHMKSGKNESHEARNKENKKIKYNKKIMKVLTVLPS